MQQFIKYLESKDLSKNTQAAYMRQVNLFAAWYDAELINCTKKDILKILRVPAKQKRF
jgi:site-specific recombinase XerD